MATVGGTLVYGFGQADSTAGRHFEFLPFTLTLAILGFAAWHHHRSILGRERTDTVRFYEYLLAAIGVIGLIATITALATVVFSRSFVGSDGAAVINATVAGLAAVGLWYRYWMRGQRAPRTQEAASTPRRLYLLVLGIITAIASAVSLIAVLVMVFQAALGVGQLSDAVLVVTSLFVSSGLAAWHLLRSYANDQSLFDDGADLAPFEVAVIASHPGMLASRFPSQARMRVIYRDDDAGVVDDEMADAIVAAVDGRPSVVWVDDTGFRVAPLR